ncbi:MAG TPA: L,D-transpeptidase [Candidatus Saccharimonadales bacterium]|nr:L,D-transpeptidase [Candidatus Saccharimonadales bacterium]
MHRRATFRRYPNDQGPSHHRRRVVITGILASLVLACGATVATVHALPHISQSNIPQVRVAKQATKLTPPTPKPTTPPVQPTTMPIVTPTPKPAAPTGPCASNTLNKLALVSISQRHMWACEGTSQVYDSPVVTGMESLAADLTPPGTYHISSKQTNLDLKGSDSTGSWNDHVSYWMQFLYDQYGAYGFHDATWRSDSDFGNIDPNSSQASHGCVELPLATAAWLYNWAPVGTTVTIES